jgi:Soluble lytic murein transglycosylase and related regulatory proteins (some contain LysM/invasin domains)
MFHKLFDLFTAFFFAFVLLTVGCSAQTEDQALASLRQMTKDGKLPPENLVTGIESRFDDKKTGALAKLLHARIRFESNDFAVAAAILNSDVFAKKTDVGDYALWLRGRALQGAGNHAEAMKTFEKLLNDYPTSTRDDNAKLLWAGSAMQTGQAARVPEFLAGLNNENQADSLLLTAKAFEAQANQSEEIRFYRKAYFYGAGTDAAKEAEGKLISLGQSLSPQNAEEAQTRADKLYNARRYSDAVTAYADLAANFPAAITPQTQLRRITAFAGVQKMADAQAVFNSLPTSAKEREEAYRQLVLGYAKAKMWSNVRSTVEEMRQKFPNGALVPKTLVDVGLAARESKNRADEGYFLKTAVAGYPNSIDVAQAQFELAWFEHESSNYAQASQMFIEHLARYVDKDTTNRGKAGYWAARDSERAGKIAEACALYDAVNYRYGANWYGYLATQRIANLKNQGSCRSPQNFPAGSLIPKAVVNLRIVTVAAETATAKELERAEKSDELSTIGLFDWAIDELNEAKKTAQNSPKINLALARHYRLKGDNVNALLALAKSYPDYSQMFPEEMGREEWDIFYPLTNWDQIKNWSQHRNLDQYQVAGLIRQETVFNPRAKSGANAYGLMQLLLPTARIVARKYGSSFMPSSGEDLFQPAINIELGTAYLRDQFDKFGRIEYVAAAYNAAQTVFRNGAQRCHPKWTNLSKRFHLRRRAAMCKA